jgi:hypothetical protein
VKARDLLLAALLLLLVGVAVADALRGGGSTPAARPPDTTTGRNSVEIPERFPRTPAPGRLVFLDDDGCRMHEVQVSTGEALELPKLETGCELWHAAHGERIAYALPGPFARLRSFRFMDLNFPLRQLRSYSTDRDVLFSQDGLDAAWCESDDRAFRIELGDEQPTRLHSCPAAFDPAGELAYITPQGLRVRDTLVVRTRDPLVGAVWGSDDSLALIYRDRIERLVSGRVTDRRRIPAPARDRPATLAPNNCIALFPARAGTLVTLDICGDFGFDTTPGTAGAFSPDSSWIAVARETDVIIVLIGGSLDAATSWPVRARALAWLG